MKCAFLDRDGVINFDYGYVGTWDAFDLLPNAIEGMRLLQDLGFSLIIVTNQSGIARGYYSENEFLKLTATLGEYLEGYGIFITRTYYCPHHPVAGKGKYRRYCECRKPKPGLIEQCSNEYDVDLKNSILIGDKISDCRAGKSAGVGRLFLIESDHPREQKGLESDFFVCRDILEVAEKISL